MTEAKHTTEPVYLRCTTSYRIIFDNMRPEKPNLNEIVLDQCRKRKIWRESNFPRARSRRRKLGTVSSNRKISLNSSVLFGKHENNNPIALSAFTNFDRRHIEYWWDRFNCLWCSPFVFLTMGRKFGSLTKGKNIVTYSLSPFEQRAFAGVTKSIANMARRVRTQLPYQLPAFISGILLYTWAMEDFRQRNRKNPKDYANDEWIFQLIAT